MMSHPTNDTLREDVVMALMGGKISIEQIERVEALISKECDRARVEAYKKGYIAGGIDELIIIKEEL